MANFAPTAEQQEALRIFKSGANLKIRAGAGTGKTSVLVLISEEVARQGRRGRYISFNKAIAEEAADRMPDCITPSTAHSLANRYCRRNNPRMMAALGKRPETTGRNGRTRPLHAGDAAKALGVTNPVQVNDAYPLTPSGQINQAIAAVNNFCKSDDPKIGWWHLETMKGVDYDKKVLGATIVPIAEALWENLTNPGRAGVVTRFGHQHYLKWWALQNPKIDGDVLFLDEAQDCQPAGTMVRMADGSEKPIESITVGDRVVSYTNSGLRLRMKGSPVTSVASRDHRGELVRVETASGLVTRYTPEHITIAKVGAAFEGKKLVYLMRRGNSFRVGTTSAYHGKSGGRRSSGLAARMHEEGGDAMWVLGAFDTKAEALIEEARVSVTFGIPDVVYQDDNRGRSAWGQANLDSFWFEMGDMTEKAIACLHRYGRLLDHPILKRKFNEFGNRAGYLMLTRACTIRACNLMEGMQVIDSTPLLSRMDQRNRRHDTEAWTHAKVVREEFDGPVWSLEVAGDHTYIGDGVVTHNCAPVLAGVLAKQSHLQIVLVGDSAQSIYRFTGAVDAMNTMGQDFGEARLTQSWRFGPEVATLANVALETLGDDMRVKGNPGIDDTINPQGVTPDAVLCRTNARAVSTVIGFLEAGLRVNLEIDVAYVKRFVTAAVELQMTGRTGHPELQHFGSWDEVLIHAASDIADEDWITWVHLIKSVGTDPILDALARVVPANRAHVTVSTAHKSKGREWNHVHLADDLAEFYVDAVARDSEWHIQDALMLIYVAITRAKKSLNPGQLVDIPKLTEAGLLLRAERQAKANEGAAAAA